ncbi:MAG: leucine-rich repeat protein [Treponema sp.]|nr:leucine-rich repeat protein [Treponema sp.]
MSCAGGASGDGSNGEAASLCISIPTGRAAYDKEDASNLNTFSVTIESSHYKASKSCGNGETLKFENIPVGNYDVVAFAKKSDGTVTAKGTATVDIEPNVTKNVKIKLKMLNWYTVNFYKASTDSAPFATSQASEGFAVAKPSSVPTATGKLFSYWTADSAATSSSARFDFSSGITSDKNLYAVFDSTIYDITWTTNISSVTVASSYNTYDSQIGMSALPAPTATGISGCDYSLEGWYEDAAFTASKKVTSIPVGTKGVKTYYAKWQCTKFTGTITDFLATEFKPNNTIATAYDITITDSSITATQISSIKTKLNTKEIYANIDLSASSMTEIPESSFGSCAYLTGFSFPSGVQTIGAGAFVGCNITSISIPNGVTEIGGRAFNLSKLTGSLSLPDSLTKIGWAAFAGCNVSSVNIPASVTYLGAIQFASTTNITFANSGAWQLVRASDDVVMEDDISASSIDYTKLAAAVGGVSYYFRPKP